MNKQWFWGVMVFLVLIGVVGFMIVQKPGLVGTANNNQTDGNSIVIDNSLDLSNKGLTKLPSYVLQMTILEKLDLSHNKLTGALPAEIRHLSNLKVLDISNNLMTGIPAEIGQLSNLRILNLSNNQFTGLPYELGNLKQLETLYLSGNQYSEQDLGVIKKGLPANVKIY